MLFFFFPSCNYLLPLGKYEFGKRNAGVIKSDPCFISKCSSLPLILPLLWKHLPLIICSFCHKTLRKMFLADAWPAVGIQKVFVVWVAREGAFEKFHLHPAANCEGWLLGERSQAWQGRGRRRATDLNLDIFKQHLWRALACQFRTKGEVLWDQEGLLLSFVLLVGKCPASSRRIILQVRWCWAPGSWVLPASRPPRPGPPPSHWSLHQGGSWMKHSSPARNSFKVVEWCLGGEGLFLFLFYFVF